MILRRIASVFVLGASALLSFAQPTNYTSKDKKAIKHYESGAECMRLQQWGCAESGLKKAAEADPAFIEPRIYLGEMNEQRGNATEAIRWYKEAVAINKGYFPPALLHLADIEMGLGSYAEAEGHYKAYIEVERDKERIARAKLGLANCTFAQEAVRNPVPFEPKNLGPGVNTADGEYYPCITADGNTLMFTRRVKEPEVKMYGEQEDFYQSRKQADGTWGVATPVAGVNTRLQNEGAGTLSPDGRFLVFTKCAGMDGSYGPGLKGLGSCDLFISRRIGDRWGSPENLGPPVNSRGWETQPSLSSDGRTLYYIRGTQTGAGIRGMDILSTKLQENGTWSKPEPLGPNVNTPQQEESVQIHPDGRTLYFSSNGHPGMGGLDIYMSRKQADGTWGPAKNLGYPINTGADENSLLVDAAGRIAFFASDRSGGAGDLDLYGFELPASVRPTPVTYITGIVKDKVTGKPLEADVELFDLTTGELATAAYSDPVTGQFLVCLPMGRNYALNAGAEGYLFHSGNYQVPEGSTDKPFTLEVLLSPITAGEIIALRNVFFNTASHALLPESDAELGKLLRLLKANAAMRVEVGGHTDDVGADAANLKLSEQRANAVRDHLIAQGIDATRITAKGYGETKPVADNKTEEGRALNRRTEVKVL